MMCNSPVGSRAKKSTSTRATFFLCASIVQRFFNSQFFAEISEQEPGVKFDTLESSAMFTTGAEFEKHFSMISRAVSFMKFKTIVRKFLRQNTHQSIARDFCDDRRRRNRLTSEITFNERS